MWDLISHAFVTFFVIIDPFGLLPLFIALTAGAPDAYRRRMAIRGSVIGGVILVFFALVGDKILSLIGISLPAFRVAGGIMLFLIALEMVFEKRKDRRAQNLHTEPAQPPVYPDISVFPLAIPLISGPGAITSSILLTGQAGQTWVDTLIILLVLLAVLALNLLMFLTSDRIERMMGQTLTTVMSRLFGILLAALAIQFIFDGVKQAWGM